MAKRLFVVAAALIDRDGRVLMAKRPEEKVHGGLWEFPGGKIAPGETPQEALVRELREGLAINTQESCLSPLGFAAQQEISDGSLEEVHLLMLLFVCRKWRGVPRGAEGQALKWVSSKALLQQDMPPADRPLAAQLREVLW